VGYGDVTPHGWTGRLVAFLVMVTGIGLFGIVVAELSAGFTLQQLTSDITTAEDLLGRKIATVAGTTSVAASKDYGAEVIEVEGIDEAYEELRARRVDAVVFDSPSLLYYLRNHPREKLILAGGLLRHESYGIAFPAGSALRERVNRALLQIRENGTYDRIYLRWFGSEQ
jgi:polar amino acid transport system substrate-binding protein